MVKKIALSIDEMKHLEELGMDTRDASMYWSTACGRPILAIDYMANNMTAEPCKKHIPAYTLQDILLHLSPAFRRMVIMYTPEEWLDIAYSKLCFQLEEH